jgi:hypothetical protein
MFLFLMIQVLMDKLAVEEKTLREIERALKKDETTK